MCFDDDPLFQDHECGYDLCLTGSDKHRETCCGITFKKDPWRLYGFSKNRHAGCCIPPATLCKRPVRAQQYNIRKGLIYECNHQGHCQRNWPGTGHHFKIYQRRNVRPQNKKQIDEAIRKLNYVPRNTARGLRSSKTYRIGLVSGPPNTPHNAFF